MAQERKKRTAGKSKSGAGRTQRQQEVQEIPEFLQGEVLIIVSLAAAVLLFLSNFHLCGVVGDFLRGVQLGLFGIVGYIFPILLFMGISFYVSNAGSLKAIIKLSGVTGVVFTVCGLAQMIFGFWPEEGEGILTFYRESSISGSGGGLIGGFLSFMLKSVVGNIGTYLLLIALLLICCVIITEKSLVNAVKRGSGKAYQHAKEDVARRKEEWDQIQEERRRGREDNVVRGVDFGSIKIQDQPFNEPGNVPFSAIRQEAGIEAYAAETAEGNPQGAGNFAGFAPETGFGAEDDRNAGFGAGNGQNAGFGAGNGRNAGFGAGNGRNLGSAAGNGYPAGTAGSMQEMGGFAPSVSGEGMPSADVFSGRIEVPPEFVEPAPFEEDKKEEKDNPEDRIISFSRQKTEALSASGRNAKDSPQEKEFSGKRKNEPLYARREIKTLEELDMTLSDPEESLDGQDWGSGLSRESFSGALDEEDFLDSDYQDDELFVDDDGFAVDTQDLREEPRESLRTDRVQRQRGQRTGMPNRIQNGDYPNTLVVEEGADNHLLDTLDDSEMDAYVSRNGFSAGSNLTSESGFSTGSGLTSESGLQEDMDDPLEAYADVVYPREFDQQENALRRNDQKENSAVKPQQRQAYVKGSGADAPGDEDDEGSIFVAEEPKRVVTAAGKVIETETELLHKKLERRREEAGREDPGAAARAQMKKQEKTVKKDYVFPPTSLLQKGNRQGAFSDQEYKDTAIKLQQTLKNFGVGVTVTNISCGPSVTRYELHPEQGVKVSKIVSLTDDIKLSLAAAEIRIEAPIPGKSAVGIEVPNKETAMVYLRDLLESEGFIESKSRLSFAVGKDIGGQPVITDIAKMPHLLIAGATGSGKSVCINTLIMSIIFKADPEDVKLIMVDPKVVELSVYNGIPHLLIPVVTDPKKASGALNWAVAEMEDRYRKFAQYNVRNLQGYNEKIKQMNYLPEEERPQKMPQIVIIIDELADLMMVVPGEVEDAICRLAQLARAAGLHLVIATQRPSVNVITGLIKANVPSRIAFAVSSGVDSRTIIDMNGAEKLLGKGDMLFFPSGIPKPQRVQGAFVSDQEVSNVVEFLTEQGLTVEYNPEMENKVVSGNGMSAAAADSSRDEYFAQAGKFIIEKEKASIGMLQRVFKIGFNRAARIMDQLADAGVVGEEEGTKPRKVLMTMEEFEQMLQH